MKIISVNVGLPREVVWKGMTVQAAIFKEFVVGAVTIRELNLAGDQLADLTVYGGPDKAVYASRSSIMSTGASSREPRTAGRPAPEFTELLRQADEALYFAKQKVRKRVQFAFER